MPPARGLKDPKSQILLVWPIVLPVFTFGPIHSIGINLWPAVLLTHITVCALYLRALLPLVIGAFSGWLITMSAHQLFWWYVRNTL